MQPNNAAKGNTTMNSHAARPAVNPVHAQSAQSTRTADELPAFLTEAQIAAYLHVSIATVRRWRWIEQGPRWRKLQGTIRYTLADLEEWIQSRPSGGGR